MTTPAWARGQLDLDDEREAFAWVVKTSAARSVCEKSRQDASLAVIEAGGEIVVEVAKVHEERLVQLGASLVGDRDPDGAPVIGAVFAPDVARLFETVNEPGGASRRVNDGVGNLAHFEPAVVALAQLQEYVEPGKGQLALGFQFGANFPRHAGVGLEEQPKKGYFFVT